MGKGFVSRKEPSNEELVENVPMALPVSFSSKVHVHCNHRKLVWKGDFKGYIIHPSAPRHDQLCLHHCKAATLAWGSTQWYKMDHKPALSPLTQDHKLLYHRLCRDCSIQSDQNHANNITC